MTQYDALLSSFSKTVFTVFDTETTGLDPKSNRVVEIGGIRFDSRGIVSRFSVLINPKVPMPPEVTKINGITDAMLAGQSESKTVLPDFMRFIGNTVLIAHNAPFDVNFINEDLSRLALPPLTNKVIDTRLFAKEVFPDLPKYALQELALRFGIEAKDAHRAEDDARVCMELFLVCMKKLREKNPHFTEEAPAPSSPAPETARTSKQDESAYSDDLFSNEGESEEDLFEQSLD